MKKNVQTTLNVFAMHKSVEKQPKTLTAIKF